MISQLATYERAIKMYLDEFGAQGVIHSINRKNAHTIVLTIESDTTYQIYIYDTDNRDVVRIDDRLFIYHEGEWKYLCRV